MISSTVIDLEMSSVFFLFFIVYSITVVTIFHFAPSIQPTPLAQPIPSPLPMSIPRSYVFFD